MLANHGKQRQSDRPVLASPNVGCFLRPVLFTTPKLGHARVIKTQPWSETHNAF